MSQRLPWLIAVACVPAVVTGAAFESVVTEHLGEPWLVGVMIAGFGLLLLAADRVPERRGPGTFSWRDALVVGGAQALALQPGVSRAGATMSAGRALGFERDAAARLSFLMGIPLIAGAALFEGIKVAREGVDGDFLVAAAVGAATAAVTAWVAVWGVLTVVRRRSFLPSSSTGCWPESWSWSWPPAPGARSSRPLRRRSRGRPLGLHRCGPWAPPTPPGGRGP